MILLGDGLQHVLWKLDMSVFEFVVRVPRRIVNGIDKLLQARLLRLCEWPGVLISPVVIHIRHFRFASLPRRRRDGFAS